MIDGEFQLVLFDQVGSVIALDNFVSIPAPFGEREHSLIWQEHFDFAGQGRDIETGLIRMCERDYDPALRRFTSPDRFFIENPEECVRSPQECDLFSYARNNPLLYTDTDGKMAKHIAKAGIVVLGRAVLPYVAAAAKNVFKENVRALARDSVLSPKGEKLIYQDAGYHHKNSRGAKSPAPTNGQATLDKCLRIKETSPWRIGVDSQANELVIFSHTKDQLFHGHVRSWTELKQGQQSVLRKNGLVDKNGKILGRN